GPVRHPALATLPRRGPGAAPRSPSCRTRDGAHGPALGSLPGPSLPGGRCPVAPAAARDRPTALCRARRLLPGAGPGRPHPTDTAPRTRLLEHTVKRFAASLLRWRWGVVLLLVGVTSGALCGVARLRVDPSSDRLL